MNDVNLKGRVALVTGASRGIGYALCKKLAAAGAHVIAMARTVGALERLDDEIKEIGGSASLMPFDLKKLQDIDKLGPIIAEKFGQLDIFVANAGILGPLSPIPHMEPRKWDEVFLVNVTVNMRLIRTLDPLLRGSDAGRALFVTSGMAELCDAYFGPYAASKAALNAMVKTYAQEVSKSNLKVNLMRPGVVDTKLLEEAYPGGYGGDTISPEQSAESFLPLLSQECTSHGELISPFL